MALGKKNTFRTRRKEIRMYRKHFIVSGAVALSVLALGVLVWYGARRPEVTIALVDVSGGVTVPHELVRDKVESTLTGTYLLLIPRSFSYLIPEKEIAAAINTIPRVHNAEIKRLSGTELAVTFDEYVPYALWCDSVALSATSSPVCLFVDAFGYAYAEAPPLLGETLIRFVVEGKKPEQGAHVYNADTLTHYRSFSDAIAVNHQHRLRAITETKDGDLILHLSGTVNILITKEANIQTVFENIESILSSEKFKAKPLESFEYIDMRFGNKVYVKEVGAGEKESTTTPQGGEPLQPVAEALEGTTSTVVTPRSTSTTQ